MDHLSPPSLVSRTYSRTQGLQVGLRGSHSAVIVLRFVLQLPTPVAQPQLGLDCGKARTVRLSRQEALKGRSAANRSPGTRTPTREALLDRLFQSRRRT